jgi:hypothetical protein
MQTDPIGYGDGLNWYNNVGGYPVNYTDPRGLVTDDQGPPIFNDGQPPLILVKGTPRPLPSIQIRPITVISVPGPGQPAVSELRTLIEVEYYDLNQIVVVGEKEDEDTDSCVWGIAKGAFYGGALAAGFDVKGGIADAVDSNQRSRIRSGISAGQIGGAIASTARRTPAGMAVMVGGGALGGAALGAYESCY